MAGLIKGFNKLRVHLFGQEDREQVSVEVPGTRKRKLGGDDISISGSNKKLRLDMANNTNVDDDVKIIPGETLKDKVMAPLNGLIRFFSPTQPKRPKDVIDLTQEEGDSQVRRVRKEDLNHEMGFMKQMHLTDSMQMMPPPSSIDLVDLEDNSSQGSSQGSADSSVSASTLGNFAFTGANIKPGAGVQDLHKRFRLVTKKEKEIRTERNKPANLTATLKAGRRTVYSKIFSPHRPRSSTGVNHCINMEARRRYENLLMKNTTTYLPSFMGGDRSYSNLFGIQQQNQSTVKIDRVGEGADEIDFKPKDGVSSPATPGTRSKPSSSLTPVHRSPGYGALTSPGFGDLNSLKPLVESTPIPEPEKRKPSSLEEENKMKDVYSPRFLNSMREKYGYKKRELERKIQAEETKNNYLEAENRKQYEDDVNERVLQHLKLTSTEIEEAEEEEEEEEDLPEITPEMEEVIRSSFRASGSTQLIEAYRIPISGKDIRTLHGLTWLNDEIINFYMQMIMARGGTGKFCKVHAFSTFFMTTYKDKGYSSIRRWTKKTDIFDKDLLIVPVHLGMHWCLATVDMQKKEINYYDSMGGKNQRCLDLLLNYIKEEHNDKKKAALDVSGWSLNHMPDIPQQMNGSDCGMFACKFAEYISRGARISFTQQEMPYFRRRMVYEIVKDHLLHP
jgi:hypothetical protein